MSKRLILVLNLDFIALSHAAKTNYFVFQICVRCVIVIVRYRIIAFAAHVGQLYFKQICFYFSLDYRIERKFDERHVRQTVIKSR